MNDIPNMIQNGSFGNTQPMGGYNPYLNRPPISLNHPPITHAQYVAQQQQMQQNNMIPIGSLNYNSTTFAQPQQQQQNGLVFNPVYQYNPNLYAPQQQATYYNPYPQYNMNNQGYYQPNYSYQGYGGFSPFMSMQKRQEIQNAQVSLAKMKMRISSAITGIECPEETLDILCNPSNPKNIKSNEEVQAERDWAEIQKYHYYSINPSNVDYYEKHMRDFMQLQYKNYHEAFDNHSLCEFTEEDYPRLMREFWIAENIKKNSTRDLSSVYNSNDYNELLKMHMSSNPYIKDLLDNSKYDNNIDDFEVGVTNLAEIFDRERRRRNVLEGKLPTYISSPEVQAQRRAFTNELMQQIYQKGEIKFEQSKSP